MLLPLLLMLAAVPAPDAGEGASGRPSADALRLPFTPDTVRQVVLGAQPRIQACYEDRMVANRRAPQGTLRTSWIIGPQGLVKGARVDWKASTLKDRPLHDCVVGVLSAMAFPPPPDGKDHPVEFPFNLQAQH